MVVTDGMGLLALFLKENGLRQADCGTAVGVSHVAVHHWLEGTQRPRPPQRHAIEVWSKGKVPVASWLTPEERGVVIDVKPFQPRRRSRRSSAAA